MKNSKEREEYFKYRLDLESRGLFQALINLEQPIAVTCSEFERFIEEHYKPKKPRLIKPGYLYKWALESKTRHPEVVSKWLYSAAIDFLLTKKKPADIISLIPLKRFVHHWLKERYDLPIDDAIQLFIDTFPLSDSNLAIVKERIKFHYSEREKIEKKRRAKES